MQRLWADSSHENAGTTSLGALLKAKAGSGQLILMPDATEPLSA